MTDLNLAYRLSPRCRFRVIGDEGVVVRLDGAEVVAINGIGASVLELLREGKLSFAEVGKAISSKFDIDASTAANDAAAFATELEAAGIVEKVVTP